MARYIDADALMVELEREVDLADDWKTAHEIANVVKYFPSADVVEVVRCKDCEHFLTPHGCGHINGMVTAIDDGFCGYGERKTDG